MENTEQLRIISEAIKTLRANGKPDLASDLDRLFIELSFPHTFEQMGEALRLRFTRFLIRIDYKTKRIRIHTTTCPYFYSRKTVKKVVWFGPFPSIDIAKDWARNIPYADHDVCATCLHSARADALAEATLDFLRNQRTGSAPW